MCLTPNQGRHMFQDLHLPSCFNPLVPELNSDHVDSAVSAPLETCRPAVAQVHIGDDVPSVIDLL